MHQGAPVAMQGGWQQQHHFQQQHIHQQHQFQQHPQHQYHYQQQQQQQQPYGQQAQGAKMPFVSSQSSGRVVVAPPRANSSALGEVPAWVPRPAAAPTSGA